MWGEPRVQYAYTDEAPVAEVQGTVVVLTFAGEKHPRVCAPPHVVREFCERTLLTLAEWEAEQHGRVVAFKASGNH